jgi:hypothetical protein
MPAVPLVDGHPRPRLEPDDVASAVDGYVATTEVAEFDQLRVERATTLDGHSATVELSAYWRPPVVTLFVPRGIRVEVTASARSVFE